MTTQVQARRWLDYSEAAAHLGVSVRFMRRAVAEGSIPRHKFGRLTRFSIDDLEAWAEKQRAKRTKAR